MIADARLTRQTSEAGAEPPFMKERAIAAAARALARRGCRLATSVIESERDPLVDGARGQPVTVLS
jgi:hypothetical protein